jgi:predicted NBD/HSP70 family sugar kinase
MGFDTPTLLRDVFQSQFTSPVVVDNDANLAALAELWFGKGRGLSDFVVITLNYGVGMGMIHGGRLMRGTRNLGPELGHTKIVPHGRACRCGQLGCLEAYVGDYALLSEAEVQGLAWQGNTDAEAMEALGAAADDGNPVAIRVLSEAAEYFGIGIANLLNLFDPVQIILALEGDKPILKYLDVIERTLRENAIAGPPHKLELVTHKWGDQLWTRGAAARALEALFADPIMTRKSEELAAASS